MSTLDQEVLRHALQIARERGFTEVEVASGDSLFAARLSPAAKAKKGVPAPDTKADTGSAVADSNGLMPLKANLVGYFRPAAQPLEPGSKVSKGDVVGVIAALGLANDLEASVQGEVVEVLVQEGDPVEYGQPIAMVKTH